MHLIHFIRPLARVDFLPPSFLLKFAGFAIGAVAVGLHLQLLAFDADGGARGYGFGDECGCANDATLSNDRITAQNGCVGINGHIVLDSWVSSCATQALTAPSGKAT